jgi:anti-sigma-K factor RskA
MTDSEHDDLDSLAAEYVLGTLAGAERSSFELRIKTDAEAARTVAAWAQRLQPLADAVPPAIPPANLWQRILRETGATMPSRRNWIALAAAAAIIAAVLFIGNLLRTPEIAAVAELAPQGGATAFTIAVTEDREKLLIRAGTVDPLQNQSYELWAVPPSGAAPISLGVIADRGESETTVPPDKRALLDAGVTLAVSLEPEGGSPTGHATGPVLFVGALSTPQ